MKIGEESAGGGKTGGGGGMNGADDDDCGDGRSVRDVVYFTNCVHSQPAVISLYQITTKRKYDSRQLCTVKHSPF